MRGVARPRAPPYAVRVSAPRPRRATRPVRVFISYSHDSDEHRAAVLDLAQRLRAAGIDAVLDRYVAAPPEGWPRWMQTQVEQAKFVVSVCTPIYRRRFDGKEGRGRGHGANFEGLLSLQTIFEGGSTGRKFVPVLFAGERCSAVIVQPRV